MQWRSLVSLIVLISLVIPLAGPSLALPTSRDDAPSGTINGRQQALDDLNGDGYPDIIISDIVGGSYVYWGSATGFSSTNRVGLPTIYGEASSVADLDKDGYNDIVFSNNGGFSNWDVDSFIYWGSDAGYSTSDRTSLPTHGAAGNAIADINYDGWPDIIFCNAMTGDWVSNITSYIYLGSATGFTANNKIELPTIGAYETKVIDLDKDNYLDIIFANEEDADDPPIHTHHVNSYIYWGSATGFSTFDRTELPTFSADDVEAADFNKDGYIDIVFSLSGDGGSDGYSCIYWGDALGFDKDSRTNLPTGNAQGVSVADLNNDTYIDILFANSALNVSYIYWGSDLGFLASNRKTIPVNLPFHPDIGDLDGNGYLDIVFAQYHGPTSPIFYGKAAGIDTSNPSYLATENAYDVTIVGGQPQPKVPDLSIAEPDIFFAPKSPVYAGTMVNVTAYVRNLGSANATQAFIRFYDGDPDVGGVFLGPEWTLKGLVPGNKVPFSIYYDAQKQGKHEIFVKIDNCTPSDKTLSNNKAFKVLEIMPMSEKPDLTIKQEELTITPAMPKAGMKTTISANIRNIGGAAAKEVVVQFLVDDSEIAKKELGSALPPGGETKLEATWYATTAGSYTIKAVVDPANSVEEKNEMNNVAQLVVTVRPPDTPDLAITQDDIAFSSSPPVVGSTIYITAIIHNIGTADAKDVDVRYLANGTPLYTVDTTFGLIPKDGGIVVLSNPFQPASAGTYNISVVLDPNGLITEINETNNVAYKEILISPNVTGVNHPPRFITEPIIKATAGVQYLYDSQAIDEDGDTLVYWLLTPIFGMSVDPTTGLLKWTPLANQTGETLVRLKVKDGRGGEAEQAFVLNVTYRKPKCQIDYPGPGQTVKGLLLVNGTSFKGSLFITQNQVRLDGGAWQKVIGIAGWTFAINTSALTNGPHKVEAQALDELSGSDIASVNFTVYNPPPPPPPDKVKYKTSVEAFPWYVVATSLIATCLTAAFRYHKERKRRYLNN